MGIELALGIASLAVGVIQGVNSYNSANAQADATAKATKIEAQSAAAQKTANTITINQQKNVAAEDRRQRVREERVRRASLMTAAENQGAGGSSGESGGISALGANFGTLISQQSSADKANAGINFFSQKALDLDTSARLIKGEADVGAARSEATNSFLNIFREGFSSAGDIFKPQPTTPLYTSGTY